MKRFIMEDLVRWKDSPRRKPLLLQGARQVGKTWILNEFGQQYFDDVAYVSFFDDLSFARVFEGDVTLERVLDALAIQTGISDINAKTLIIFDEIQECPLALSALKMFSEKAPELALVAAGSLLGVALHRGVSFPVGKIDHLTMYPMTFTEFLLATDEASYNALKKLDFDLIDSFGQRYEEALKHYYFVGGMPEAVSIFKDTNDYDAVREIQNRLLYDYEHDFSKYAGASLSERIRLLWTSIPAQLGRENKKFVYSAVKKGARARSYEEAIQWLVDAGLVLRLNRISKAGLPLASYEDKDAFKLYLLDVGLLGAASRLSPSVLLEGNELFTEFKGSLTENYVFQEIVASNRVIPYYWSAEQSSGEIDFVYDYDNSIIPLEVKAETNLRAKSLRSFVDRYDIAKGYRVSLAPYKEQSWVVNIPLYCMHALPGLEITRPGK